MRSNSALRRTIVATCLLLLPPVAVGQTPSQPETSPSPPNAAAPKPEDESEALRIRGLVETADAAGVIVQLSKGITIRVDIAADTPVFSASRISAGDLQGGATLSVRTRAAQTAGENSSALEVLLVALTPPASFPGMSVNGAFKGIDKSGEHPALVVSERGSDRKFTITSETSFWKLQSAELKDVKPGVSISVLVGREASGAVSARRAVFGSTPPGAALPL